jgi:general secretion pathway protein K
MRPGRTLKTPVRVACGRSSSGRFPGAIPWHANVSGIAPSEGRPARSAIAGGYFRHPAHITRHGFILVETLLVIAALIALVVVLAANEHTTQHQYQEKLSRRRAQLAVESAMARALTVLQTANPNLVTLNDDWATLGDNGNQEFDIADANAYFRMQIVDAGSLLNLNSIGQPILSQLPITQDLIDCFLDWTQAGENARSDGAKDSYYNGLTQPYNAKLGPLTVVNEMLLIKGWTAQQLYTTTDNTNSTAPIPEDTNGNPLPIASLVTVDSECPNTRATGGRRINLSTRITNPTVLNGLGLNPALISRIQTSGPFTSFSQLFALPGMTVQSERALLNAATFTTATTQQGLFNANTATQAVLQLIPNVTPDIATAIVTQQTTGFTGLGDLTTISGLSGTRLAAIAGRMTVGSDTWIVRCYGVSGSVGIAAEVVVRLTNGNPQILNWMTLSSAAIPSWWDWNDQPDVKMDAGAAQTESNQTTSAPNG